MSTNEIQQMRDRALFPQDIEGGFDIREWVSSKVYWRGVDYFHDDRVISFELGDDNSIHDEVEGSEIYEVRSKWISQGAMEI